MKSDPDKLRTTSVTVYLSKRRKLALGILASKIAGGSIATLVTKLIEDNYGADLDKIEPSIFVPGSSDEKKDASSDEKEEELFVA